MGKYTRRPNRETLRAPGSSGHEHAPVVNPWLLIGQKLPVLRVGNMNDFCVPVVNGMLST